MIQKITVSLRLKTGIGEIVMANNACRKLPVGIQCYFLGFPNQEVKQVLYEVVLPTSRH